MKLDKWELDKYKALLQKCRKIASTIHHSTVLSFLLTQNQTALCVPVHQIVHDVPTRWNSIFLMLNRILEQWEAVNATFVDYSNRRKYDDLKLTETDMQNLIDIVNVLQPFYDAT
jgi:hypothetical protein